MLTGKNDYSAEVSHRVTSAGSSIKASRRTICSRQLRLPGRFLHFKAVSVLRLVYNAQTLPRLPLYVSRRWAKLYTRGFRTASLKVNSKDHHISDKDFYQNSKICTPNLFLRKLRLRYFARFLHHGTHELKQIVHYDYAFNKQSSWLALIYEDLDYLRLHSPLGGLVPDASPLEEPILWHEYILANRGQYVKVVQVMETDVVPIVEEEHTPEDPSTCQECGRSFNTRAALHGRKSAFRAHRNNARNYTYYSY